MKGGYPYVAKLMMDRAFMDLKAHRKWFDSAVDFFESGEYTIWADMIETISNDWFFREYRRLAGDRQLPLFG